MRHLLPAFALLIAAPALAQTAVPDTVPAIQAPRAAVDAAVVGTWELAEVEEGGVMDELGAEIEALMLRIEADGDATVEMEVLQDHETTAREDAFHCTTQDGQIVSDTRPTISYQVLDDGQIRLTDPKGIVVRMKRTDSGVATQ